MRVVGGTARGRTLVAPAGRRTRPTADRVREAVFNALWSRGALDEARIVDLFAGSGALGIEALSRGGAHATFVDSDRAARAAIARNLDTCGFADRAEIIAAPVERFLAALHDADNADNADSAGGRFDLAFCDPPYAFDGWAGILAARPAPLIVAEAGEPIAVPEGWTLARESRYGAAWVGFLEETAPDNHRP